MTIDEAINGINSGKWTFYTFEGGHRANVVIRTSSAGRQYLTTLPDNFAGNNLSRLRQYAGSGIGGANSNYANGSNFKALTGRVPNLRGGKRIYPGGISEPRNIDVSEICKSCP